MGNPEHTPPDEGGILSPRLLSLIAWVAAGYFLLRLIYFVIAIHPSVPPDEPTHFARVAFFAKFFLLPSGVPGDGYSHLWTMRYHPPLYYLLAGKWLLLNVFPVGDIAFARLLSVGLSCLTALYGWRFVRLLSPSPLVHLLFLVMMTNTLMFSFLSAAVNYDNLVNLLAAAALYYMTRYLKQKEPQALLAMLLALLLGGLTKTALLPFAFACVAGLLLIEARAWRARLGDLSVYWSTSRFVPKVFAGAIVALLGLNALLYGSNLLTFGHLVPRNSQVLTEADYKAHPMAARSGIYMGYLRGERSLEESIALAKELGHGATSRDVINLLNFAVWRQESEGPFEPMSRLDYAVHWSKLMLYSVYGVMGHSVAYKGFWGHVPYLATFLIAVVFMAVGGIRGRVAPYEWLFVAMFAFYVAILMQVVNYGVYLNFQLPHISVQGRYLFPFLLPIYGLTAKYVLSWKKAPVQYAAAAVIGMCFICGDFPFFLSAWGGGPW